jgi:hypothetical protein
VFDIESDTKKAKKPVLEHLLSLLKLFALNLIDSAIAGTLAECEPSL